MTTRRNFIAGVAGTATTVGLAGCLGFFDDDENGEQIPGGGVETDDELLQSLADPSGQVPPLYFAGYQYDVGPLQDELDLGETIPRLGGSFAGLIDEQIDDLSLGDVERFTGAIYNSTASAGDLQIDPLPSGQSVQATGEFDAAPVVDWIEENAPHESMGESEGYERYMIEVQDGQGFEALAISDGVFIVANRTDVTARNADYDSHEETAEDALAIEIDQREREDAPIADAAPAFAETVETLDSGAIRAGAGYALVPLGSDIGTQSHDDAVSGVVGAGLSSDLENVQRSLTYLDTGIGSAETVQQAYEDSTTEELPTEGWEFETDDASVLARASLDESPSAAMLETALPVPGYESLFQRINPGNLNRQPTPRVFFQPRIDDGQLEIEHVGGEDVEGLRVRYLHDGDQQLEDWEGTITQGETFTSEETIDSGSRSWVVWQPDTVDAAVLTRFETPE